MQFFRPVTESSPLNTDNLFGQEDQVYTDLGYLGHPGIDFKCLINTPVYAADKGRCIFSGQAGTAGIMVTIGHDYGKTRYLHLNSSIVAPGTYLMRGQLIGYSGNTGLSSGPHLHFDFYLDGVEVANGYGGRVDPLPYIESSTPPGATMPTEQQRRIVQVIEVNMNDRSEELKQNLAQIRQNLQSVRLQLTEAEERIRILDDEITDMLRLIKQEFGIDA
jgi:septal ring factor EnvC (AmiA/AmiB activator)